MNSPLLHFNSRKQLRRKVVALETDLWAMENKWRIAAAKASRLTEDRKVLVRVIGRIGSVIVRGAIANDNRARDVLARCDVPLSES